MGKIGLDALIKSDLSMKGAWWLGDWIFRGNLKRKRGSHGGTISSEFPFTEFFWCLMDWIPERNPFS
jgi:hypothetical protein